MAADTFKNLFWDHATTDLGINGFIGTRFYPSSAPTSGIFPYATYQIISDEHQSHMGAASGYTKTTVQVDIWAASYANADQVAEKFRKAFDGYQGKTWSSGATVINVSSIRITSQHDGYISPTDASQKGIYRVTMDFSVWHTETVPLFA